MATLMEDIVQAVFANADPSPRRPPPSLSPNRR